MEGSCYYTEYAVADIRQGVFPVSCLGEVRKIQHRNSLLR
jgi:hypothetical protein